MIPSLPALLLGALVVEGFVRVIRHLEQVAGWSTATLFHAEPWAHEYLSDRVTRWVGGRRADDPIANRFRNLAMGGEER